MLVQTVAQATYHCMAEIKSRSTGYKLETQYVVADVRVRVMNKTKEYLVISQHVSVVIVATSHAASC